MSNESMIEKAIEAIIALNAALTNIRLYPPTSAMIVNSIDSLHSIFQQFFEQQDSIVFAESERNLVISGEALDEKELSRPQVAAFIQLMRDLGIKSIAFEKGLEKSDIMGFLEVVSKKPDDLRNQGGVGEVMSTKAVKNILLDKKLYVAMDKDQRIVSAGDVKETGQKHDEGKGPPPDERRKGEDRRKHDDLEYLAKGGVERRGEERREEQLLNIKDGINSILKGEDKAFADKKVMQALTPTVLDLMAHGKDKAVKTIINVLGKGLLNENEKIRAEVASVLARIGFKLITGKRMDEMINISQKLIEWIQYETTSPVAYKHVCDQLRAVSQYLIIKFRFEEAKKTISPFYLIHTGEVKKDESIQGQSGIVLESVASDKILEILVSKAQASEKDVKEQAVELLVMLGSGSDAAARELEIIQKEHVEEVKTEPEKIEPRDDEYSRQMKLLDQHLEKEDTESAVKLLFDMIVKYAGEKNFEKAEFLRDKLTEVNPMALTEIVKSGEVIDEAKIGSIDQEHLDRWENLYQNLIQEETSTLFYAMKSARFEAKQIIFKQGDRNSNLYFVNKGQLKMFFKQGDEAKVIKEINPGDITGEETFFNLTVCTASVTAFSEVELNFLEKDILRKWEEAGLGIESKLRDYSLKLKKTADILQEKGFDRRSEERVKLSSLKVSIQPLDLSGSPVGKVITGTLADICQGGVSFYLKIPKENVARMFEEPKMNLKFKIDSGEAKHTVDQNGTVVAVIHHFYDFSIHVKFDKVLDEKVFEDIRESAGSTEEELDIFIDS